MTFYNNTVFAVPAWHAGQPPIRNAEFFHILHPLRVRFTAYLAHANNRDPSSEWWLDLWRLIDAAVGQWKEPFECEPLAIFNWSDARPTDTVPLPNWPEWVRRQEAEGHISPTPAILRAAVGRIDEGREARTVHGSTEGAQHQLMLSNLDSRPPRSSKSVTRRRALLDGLGDSKPLAAMDPAFVLSAQPAVASVMDRINTPQFHFTYGRDGPSRDGPVGAPAGSESVRVYGEAIFVVTTVQEAQRVAAKYLMEYHYNRNDPDNRVPSGALEQCVAHDWQMQAIPKMRRAFRLLSIIRNCIWDFVVQGMCVAFATGPEVDQESKMLNVLHSPRQRKIDAYELDSYIRSAAESSDLIEHYIKPLGPALQNKVRALALPLRERIARMGAKFDWGEEHTGTYNAGIWRSVLAEYGEEAATVAFGVIKAYAEIGRPNVATEPAGVISGQAQDPPEGRPSRALRGTICGHD